jgi:hypothetical protein
VLFLTACLTVLGLLAVLLGRTGLLVRLGERAALRLERGRAVPMLWGLAAVLLVLLLAIILFQTHVLALLGVLVLVVGLVLASLGLGVVAYSLGQRLAEAGGDLGTDSLEALRLGLWSLLLASFVPFAGWLIVLLALASGIGAVLETLVTRTPSGEAE